MRIGATRLTSWYNSVEGPIDTESRNKSKTNNILIGFAFVFFISALAIFTNLQTHGLKNTEENSNHMSADGLITEPTTEVLNARDELVLTQAPTPNIPTNTPYPTVIPSLPQTPTNKPQPTIAYTCNCSSNLYNCSDFVTAYEAQLCYEYCGGLLNDIHGLDGDNDGYACDCKDEGCWED